MHLICSSASWSYFSSYKTKMMRDIGKIETRQALQSTGFLCLPLMLHEVDVRGADAAPGESLSSGKELVSSAAPKPLERRREHTG